MDDELRKQIIDRFTSEELIDYLQLPVEVIVDTFRDEIEEVSDEIEEFLRYGR